MSDAPENEPGPAAPEPGVFGNLPDSRPGTRSPRRDPPGAKPTAAKAEPKPPRERPAPKPPREPAPQPEEPQGGGGLEDIAWAGVAAAAEAATIGVRLASRAIEALRGTAEKD
jgi:hypothetical protein